MKFGLKLSVDSSMKKAFLVVLLFLPLVNVWELILKDPILNYDDRIILLPLSSINSLSDYFGAVLSNKISDLQPIRDLFIFTIAKLNVLSGLSLFHFMNFSLVYLMGFATYKIMRQENIEKSLSLLLVVCLVNHPILATGFGWIASSKHLLACTFCLFSVLYYLKEKKIYIFFFLLALYSHPIVSFMSLWFPFKKFLQRKKIEHFHFFPFYLMAVCLFLNILKGFVQKSYNQNIANPISYEGLISIISSFGRGIQLMIIPIHQSVSYMRWSPLNLMGLLILLIFLYVVWKKKNIHSNLIWLFPIILIFIPTAPYFVNDSYLFLPLVFLFIFIGKAINTGSRKYLIPGAFLVITFFCLFRIAITQWNNDLALHLNAYKKEAYPQHGIIATTELSKFDPNLAVEILQDAFELLEKPSEKEQVDYLRHVYVFNNISVKRKFSLIEKYKFLPDKKYFYKALVLMKDGKNNEAEIFNYIKKIENINSITPYSLGLMKKECEKKKYHICKIFNWEIL